MDKTELIELLADLADGDLAEGADIDDHPCSVAIRALKELKEIIDNKDNYIEGLEANREIYRNIVTRNSDAY